MNNFFTAQHFLIEQLQTDPVLSLAYAVSLFDPLWNHSDDIDTPEHETDTLYIALHVLRRGFPILYFETLQALQMGKSYSEIENLICHAIQARGIPLEHLEWIGYGIPLPAYGVDWDDPELPNAYPEASNLLACFGVVEGQAISDEVYNTARRVGEELTALHDKQWAQIGWTIQWLFACTGNSSVDYTPEIVDEFQPLSWDTDDIAFACAIIEEAEQIMGDALAGLQYLTNHPEVYLKLNTIIKGEDHVQQPTEPSLTQRDERTTELVA